jgi:rSAM/selenodomain-associated transferase 2
MKTEISVIVPVLNEEKQIGDLIRYLTKHGEGYVSEIIISDGGSTDQTVPIAEELGAIVLTSSGRGRARQMNAGAGVASSQILYFLHADSLPPPSFCQEIAGALNKGADAGSFTLRFDTPGIILKLYSLFTHLPITAVRFGDQSLFVKRDLFEFIGGFNNELIVMEDQQIVRDLKRIGKFVLIHKPVTTSARKYKSVGVFKLQFIFTVIWAGYYLGASQNTLRHIYQSLIRTE